MHTHQEGHGWVKLPHVDMTRKREVNVVKVRGEKEYWHATRRDTALPLLLLLYHTLRIILLP